MRQPGQRHLLCPKADRLGERRRRPPGWAPIALAALGIALAGCGGSSHKTTAQASTMPDAATSTATTSTSPTHPKKHAQKRHAGARHRRFPPAPPRGNHGKHVRPSPGPALTLAQLKQKADAACATANAKEAAISRPSDFDTSARSAAAYLLRIEQIQAAEVRALHLNPPRSVEPRYISFFAGMAHQQLLVLLAANEARGGQSGYLKEYQSATTYRQQFVTPAAKQLGLSSCA